MAKKSIKEQLDDLMEYLIHHSRKVRTAEDTEHLTKAIAHIAAALTALDLVEGYDYIREVNHDHIKGMAESYDYIKGANHD